MLVALGSWNVGGSPRKQRPTRCRPRQIAAPDLYDAGLARDDQKRRGQRLDRIGCYFLEQLTKPRKLGPPQRVPILGTFVRPRDLDAIPHQAEIQRRIDIPPERRGGRQGFAIAIAPGRKHAIRRAVGPPRDRSIGDEPVKSTDDRFRLLSHLSHSVSRGYRRSS